MSVSDVGFVGVSYAPHDWSNFYVYVKVGHRLDMSTEGSWLRVFTVIRRRSIQLQSTV